MKKLSSFNRRGQIKRLVMGCGVVGVVAVVGIAMLGASRAASSSIGLYLSPPTGTYSVGNTFTVGIMLNTSTSLDGVQANLNYPQSELQFVSVSTSTGAFSTPGPANGGGNGTVTVDVFTIPPGVSGNQVTIADVNFKVSAAGSAQIEFASSSQVGDTSGNLTTPTLTGGTYTLQTPTCPSGQTGTPPNCVTPTCPSGQTGTPPNCTTPTCAAGQTGTPPNCVTPPPVSTAPTGGGGTGGTGGSGGTTSTKSSGSSSTSTSSGSSAAATNYTPSGVSTPVAVPGNNSVKVSAPVTVSPSPAANSPAIAKVEYFLNSKLLVTVDNAPFTYKIDTTNILNGTYKFTTETFYVGGKTSSVSQQLVIKNPIGFTQIRLAAQKYAPPIVIPIILLVCVFFMLRSGILRNITKRNGSGPPTPKITVGGNDVPPTSSGPTIPANLVGEEAPAPGLEPKVYAPGTVYGPHNPTNEEDHAHL